MKKKSFLFSVLMAVLLVSVSVVAFAAANDENICFCGCVCSGQ